MKHTTKEAPLPKLRLTRRGQIVATATIFAVSAAGATTGIVLQEHQHRLSEQRLEQVVQQQRDALERARVQQQVQEDDGPQDGSTDCWSNCPTK